MQPRVTAITLGTLDLARARRFYVDALGWPLVHDSPDILMLDLGGTVLILFPRAELAADAHLDPATIGTGHVALAHNVRDRDDVDRVLLDALTAGATLLKPAHDAPWGGRSGYFADPDGQPWEVAWNPHWRYDEAGRVLFDP